MPKFIDKNGIAKVRMITPGQGSSAYYEGEQLERDRAAFDGGLVFLDHPGRREESDRPERSLRDLIGPIVETPIYERDNPHGEGLYGKVRIAKHWRDFVEDLGPAASIRAGGKALLKKIDGKLTKVAEKFNPGAGFDLVTKAGRGGGLVPLLEAAQVRVNTFMESQAFVESGDGRSSEQRFLEWMDTEVQEDSMEAQEVQLKLQEAEGQIVTLTEAETAKDAEIAQLKESIALRDTRDIVTTKINETDLPDVTKTRLIESLSTSATLKEGVLDKEALETKIAAEIVDAKAYIESLEAVKPGIRGMNSGPKDGNENEGVGGALFNRVKADRMKEGMDEAGAIRSATAFIERG